MIIVNMHEAKSTLSQLVKAAVEDGEVVRIARNGQALVELKALPEHRDPLRLNPRLAATLLADPSLPEAPKGWEA